MITSVARKDYERFQEDWHELRVANSYQPSTIAAARKDLRSFSTFLEEKKLNWINGKVLCDYIKWLDKTKANSAGAINRKRGTIHMYIQYLRLINVKGATAVPIEYLDRARDAYKGAIKVPTMDEIITVLETPDRTTVLGYRDYLLYALLYSLGLRVGEVTAINISDIDFKTDTIVIHGKGRRERTLPIVLELRKILKKYLVYRRNLINAKELDALFISKKGNRLAIRTVEENFQKVIDKNRPLTLKKITPHTLRHAFASHAMEKKSDLLVIKAILGHAKLATTEVYLHPSLAMLQHAVEDTLVSEIFREVYNKRKLSMKIQGSRKQLSG